MVEYDDLAELPARELPSLKIADSSRFSQGLIPALPKVRKIINLGSETTTLSSGNHTLLN